MKIFDFIYGMKLRHKIFLACVSITFIINTFIFAILYTNIQTQIEKEFYNSSSSMLIQASSFIDEKLKGTLERVKAMRVSQTFNKTLSDFLYYDSARSNAAALTEFSEAFMEIRAADDFIYALFMYTPKAIFIDMTRPRNSAAQFEKTQLYSLINNQKEILYWGGASKDEVYLNNSVIIPVSFQQWVEGYNGDVFIIIELKQQKFIDYMSRLLTAQGSGMMIIDNDGKEIMPTNNEFAEAIRNSQVLENIQNSETGRNTISYNEKEYIIMHNSTNLAPWKIINIIPRHILLQNVNQMRNQVLLILGICVFVLFALALAVSNSITKPLYKLQKTMAMINVNNLDISFEYPYNNEIGQLGSIFNYMIGEVKSHIDMFNQSVEQLKDEKEKVKIEQLLKRRAELKALQAQINPHFLYNTLDLISWKSDEIGAAEIGAISKSLAGLFRIVLSRGNELIPVSNEIEHVKNYLVIQQMRYEGKFTYSFKVQEEIYDLYVIKLLLQPLVENAIYHGIKGKDGHGLIEITGEIIEGKLVFNIEDNGTGVNDLNLRLINKRLSENFVSDKNGYGIYNVNERVKLYFGQEYGLKLLSISGQGTKSILILPIVQKEEVEKYVQYFTG